jgi:hypothetical protein
LINEEVHQDIRLNAIEIGDIQNFIGFPCKHDLCQNGGVCQPYINRFKCICANGYSGEYCQSSIESLLDAPLNRNKRRDEDLNFNHPIYLDGHSQLFYKNRISDM